MARQTHSQYNYSYDNLKVLLGGWNTWKEENGKDPNAYPIETAASGSSDTNGAGVVIATVASNPQPVNTPAGNSAGTPQPNLQTLPTTAP